MTSQHSTRHASWRLLLGGSLVALTLLLTSGTALAQDDAEETSGEEASSSESSQEQDANSLGSLRRSNRMEFDARLVRGETAGSGAVFLFQRAPRALPSMVPLRKSYLHRSVDQVLTPTWQKPKKKSVTSASSEEILTSDVVHTTTSESVTPSTTEAQATSKDASKSRRRSKKKKKSKN